MLTVGPMHYCTQKQRIKSRRALILSPVNVYIKIGRHNFKLHFQTN